MSISSENLRKVLHPIQIDTTQIRFKPRRKPGSQSQDRSVNRTAVTTYQSKLEELTDDQRMLLEMHQRVMEETKSLPRLESERDAVESETKALLQELSDMCDEVVRILDGRTELRRRKVEEINNSLRDFGLRLSVESYVPDDNFSDLSTRFTQGAAIWSELQSQMPDERRLHRRLGQAYKNLKAGLLKGYMLFFSHAEFGNFIGVFENEDLAIGFKVGKKDEEFSPIGQLSAGQRCTAVFPLLLKLQEWPLFIDQPEDNLDNRHIADVIAPAVINDKRSRQILFTSHNANLVVLSDPEHIVAFEGTGSEGWVEERGFLSTRYSAITKHVLDILDGGEKALEQRYRKYGSLRT